MAKFWFLLAIAFIDLAIAVILVNWGHAPVAFLFLLMALVLGVYAFASTPTVQRDSRGRLQRTEVPYSSVLGTVGAIAILTCAGYVAFVSSRPPSAEPRPVARVLPAPRAAAPVDDYQPPRSYAPAVTTAALYKCVDAAGHNSFQSQPCAAGSSQVWVRDATPEAGPSRAQLQRQARARQAADQQAAWDRAARANGSGMSPESERQDPEDSSACRSARAADAAYRRQPLKYVKHDGLRWHGDQIRRACN